jgi:hypothetical protein
MHKLPKRNARVDISGLRNSAQIVECQTAVGAAVKDDEITVTDVIFHSRPIFGRPDIIVTDNHSECRKVFRPAKYGKVDGYFGALHQRYRLDRPFTGDELEHAIRRIVLDVMADDGPAPVARRDK